MMKIGKVPENILKRSVFGQLQYKRPEVLIHAGAGEDCTAVAAGEKEALVLTTDPITGAADAMGELAVHVTVNDIASAGAEPIGILVTLLLPEETEEEALRTIMAELEQTCAALKVEIMGGHTEITDAVNRPVISVTGVGTVRREKLITTAGAKPGQDIVMTKWAGLEGSMILADELLRSDNRMAVCRLSEEFLKVAAGWKGFLSVLAEARIAVRYGVTSMHDVTEGGIFGALWELGEASDVGFEVPLASIPIKQETIEICECLDINPYMLISSGSLLMTTVRGHELVRTLQEAGIDAAVIGTVKEGKDRVIASGQDRRYLEPPKSDELYRGKRGIKHGVKK